MAGEQKSSSVSEVCCAKGGVGKFGPGTQTSCFLRLQVFVPGCSAASSNAAMFRL